jgi:hypothetical protein
MGWEPSSRSRACRVFASPGGPVFVVRALSRFEGVVNHRRPVIFRWSTTFGGFMPNQHKHKLVGIRGAPEELVEKVKKAAPEGNVSKLTIKLWQEYVGEGDSPARPNDTK